MQGAVRRGITAVHRHTAMRSRSERRNLGVIGRIAVGQTVGTVPFSKK